MIGTLLLAGFLVGAPGKKDQASDVMSKIDAWMDTALVNSERVRERQHRDEKGAGKIHLSIFPTYYDSPFNPKWDWA